MSLPGFGAEQALSGRRQAYRTGSQSPRATGVVPQEIHRSPTIKRPLLNPPAHQHTCTGAYDCASMVVSGVCGDAGLTTWCSDTHCWC